jgi:hypothetical protein
MTTQITHGLDDDTRQRTERALACAGLPADAPNQTATIGAKVQRLRREARGQA